MLRNYVHSPNFTQGRNGYSPIAIVIHIMEGTLDGTDSWFQDPASKVSAHYGIGKNGDLHQYVEEADTAWHAGRVNAPTWPLIKKQNDSTDPYIDPNFYSIGIEHEGYEDTDWTDQMYQTSSNLIAEIAKKWDIPLDRDHVVGHHEIYSLKTCPGSKVDFNKLIQMAISGNPSNPVPTPQPVVPTPINPQPPTTPVSPASPSSAGTQDSGTVYSIYNKVIKRGKATTLGNVNVRSAPGSTQPIIGTVPPNIQLAFDGYADNGESINGNARWYYTDEGNWFWSGAVK